MNKKVVSLILAAGFCGGMAIAQGVYTKGTRIDDTGTGVVYVGKAVLNTTSAKTSTVSQLEASTVWMIKKITSSGVYVSGGDENAYSYAWTNRAAGTNIIVYK